MANEIKYGKILNRKKKVAVILGDPRLPDRVKFGGKFNPEDIEVVEILKCSLSELDSYEFIYLDNHCTLIKDLRQLRGEIDYAFNLCDEGFFNNPEEEKNIPEMLEIFGIPYTGAGPECMEICYDKSHVRQIAHSLGVSVPRGFIYGADLIGRDFSVIIKPARADGGFGITKESVIYSTDNKERIDNAISLLRKNFRYTGAVIIEEFLIGDEITLGIIGNPSNYTILPPTKEDYSGLPEGLPPICGHEAKWDPNSPYWQAFNPKPVELEDKARQEIESGSKKLFENLRCRDYARIDWRSDSYGNPKLLEVNPNPGWCNDGHLAKAAAHAGISYTKMLEMILESAEKRLGINYF